jgi:hypothetical protein
MGLQLDEYRAKLIDSVLFACSQQEVERFIDTAMKAMDQNKVNKHIVCRFVERIINDLESFNPMKKQAQQWSNIKVARVLFNRIKVELNTVAT